MNASMLILAAAFGQCSIYDEPVHFQTCPTYRSTAIHEKVYFSGDIRSRCIVEAVLGNGKKITVPVINGYMPSVRVTNLSDGSVLREYDYRNRDVYDGGVIEYGTAPAAVKRVPVAETRTPAVAPAPALKQMPRYTDEDFDMLRRDIRGLEEKIRTLKDPERTTIQAPSLNEERPPATLQADPIPLPRSPMKKPSEFGQDK